MFGKSILVAPIVNAQYTQEKLVKLKENDGWDKNNVQKFENKAPVDFMQAKSAKVYLPAVLPGMISGRMRSMTVDKK